MKILKFNDFASTDLKTIQFIEGKITESEYIDYLNLEVFNESIIDFTNYIKDKIVSVLYSFIVQSSKIGFTIINKFKKVFEWIISTVSKWKEKHPVLFRVIIITLIIVILLMVSTSSAYAQSKGQPIPDEQINVAIGWLNMIKGKTDLDLMEINKAIAHLVDLKDGNIEIENLGQNAVNIADSAIVTANKIISTAKEDLDKGDSSSAKMCIDLMNKGSEFVSAVYSKIGDTESIKLNIKP